MTCALFAILFAIFFCWFLFSIRRIQPAVEILDRETPEAELLKTPLFGFVAMEYFWFILNRTFVVASAPDGLYGWRASGPVTNSDRDYFRFFQEMTEDSHFMRDRSKIERLARLTGGFFLERSAIVSVASDNRSKWGMGGIPHSGRIHLNLRSGASREFILLGSVVPEDIRNRIVSTLGIDVRSIE